MAKKNNKGFGLVEIIIAIAVFVMLVVPIVNQLTTSMSLNVRSKTTQITSEYGQYVVEYIKSIPLSDVGKDNLFDGKNKLQLTTPEETKTVTVGGKTVEYKTMTYQIPKADAVKLPGAKSTYYGTITLDTKDYALSQEGYRPATAAEVADSSITTYEIDGEEYVALAEAMTDPNQVNVGNITNLDNDEVAIIPGSTANFDKTAADAIFTLKADLLKEEDEEKWQQLMYGDAAFNDFDYDTVTKTTTIKLTKNGGIVPTYTVSCELKYQDSNTKYKVNLPSYNVYQQTFKGGDGAPKIFLMYNPCVYNGEYVENDYIVFDTSECLGEKAKLYLIETGSYLSDNIKKVMDDNGIPYSASLATKKIDDPDNPGNEKTVYSLVDSTVNESGTRVKRENTKICFNFISGTKEEDVVPVDIFTNKDLSRINDYSAFAGNFQPGKINADSTIDHKVKTLAEDTEYEGRLYTVTVNLYDAADDAVVGTYTGSRGAE